MNPKRKKKLVLILSLMTGLTVVFFLAFFALSDNIDHFYTPTQVERKEVLAGQRLKIGGLVKDDSVKNSTENLKTEFVVTDRVGEVVVEYEGILPDLFREGQGVVVKGVLDENQRLLATSVLAKHDENYTPSEAAAALMQAQKEIDAQKAADQKPITPTNSAKQY